MGAWMASPTWAVPRGLWCRAFGRPGFLKVHRKVFVFQDCTPTDPEAPGNSDDDVAVVKFDSSGTWLWTDQRGTRD